MKKNQKRSLAKTRCKVLGCLRSGYLTVIVGYDYRMIDGGVIKDIPVHLIPWDLRMPNSKFQIISRYPSGEWLYVEPLDCDLDT